MLRLSDTNRNIHHAFRRQTTQSLPRTRSPLQTRKIPHLAPHKGSLWVRTHALFLLPFSPLTRSPSQSPLHGLLPRKTPRRLPNLQNPLHFKISLHRHVHPLRPRKPLANFLSTLRKHLLFFGSTHHRPRSKHGNAMAVAPLVERAENCQP